MSDLSREMFAGVVRASHDPEGVGQAFDGLTGYMHGDNDDYRIVPLLKHSRREELLGGEGQDLGPVHSATYVYHPEPGKLVTGAVSGIEGMEDGAMFGLAADMVDPVQFDGSFSLRWDSLLSRLRERRDATLLAAYAVSSLAEGDGDMPLFAFSAVFKEADDFIDFPSEQSRDLWRASSPDAQSTGAAAALFYNLCRNADR